MKWNLCITFCLFLGLTFKIAAGKITAFSHSIVYPNLKFRILGKQFPCNSESMKVYLGDRESKILKCRDYEILIEIPDMKKEGYYPVIITSEESNIDSDRTVHFLYVD
jgi:hypothetical protein